MTVVTLTFVASEKQITSGIPQDLTIESNIASTIYYTIDGTEPTIDSLVYTSPIALPTNEDSVTVCAFGVDGLNVSGPILTQTFSADWSRVRGPILTGQEGVVLQRDGTNPEYVIGYDADGVAGTYINFEPEIINMEEIHSEKGFDGIAEGTHVNIGAPDPFSEESTRYDDTFVEISTPLIAEFFDPEAKCIIIDTREDNEIVPILRPNGSLDNIYNEFQGARVRNSGEDIYVSGGFSARFYNHATQTMTSYYFDHNDSRWIKNTQQLPNGAPAMPQNGVGIANNAKIPLVFPWILYGRPSKIV